MVNIKKAKQGLFTLLIISLFSFQSIGQVYHLGRFEMPFDYSTQDFEVIPNGSNGFLVVTAKRIESSNEFRAEFTHLNNNFEVEWVDSVRLSKIFYIKGHDFNDRTNYLLLQDRSQNDYLKLITVDPKNKRVNELDQRRLARMRVTDFSVIRNSAIIVGYIDAKPAAFIYDLESKALKTLNQVFQNKSEILEVKVNNDGLTFNVLTAVVDKKKDRTIKLNTFDYEGNLIRAYILETQPNFHLINAISSSIYDVEQVNVGLYSYKAATSPSGYFINHVNKAGEQSMRYLPFGQFNTFFDHEGGRKSQKLKSKSLNQFNSNKNFRYKTEAIFQPMLETEDRLVVFAEFFKPWSGSGWNAIPSKRDGFTRSTWHNDPTNRGFLKSGFNFSHTFTIVLDKQGNLLNDYSAKLNEGLSGRLTSYGEFSYTKENAFYAYYYNKRFRVHNTYSDELPLQIDLPLQNTNDLLRYESEGFGDFVRWNGSKYLIYGIQHIRDANDPNTLRKVYFVNGMGVEPNFNASDLD